jgi:anti-sigma regulatory factor (Ser/Thr protein kinase)
VHVLSNLAGGLDGDSSAHGVPVREATFEPTFDSVRAARHFVVDVLPPECRGDEAERLALVASELVTNAVLHAGTPFTVQVLRAPESIWVAVRDATPQPPSRRTMDAEAVSGRGLRIVEKVALRWGVHVEPESSGKWVWAQVSIRAAEAGGNCNGSAQADAAT